MALITAARTRQGVLGEGALVGLTTLFAFLWSSGLSVDVWYHVHRGFQIETFFTAAHALMYGGMTLAALPALGYLFESVRIGTPWAERLPAGFGLLLVGWALYGMGGAFDFLWHATVGFEATYDAVFQWLGPDGDRISDLAERCGVSKQAMGETIDWLERHGYVERVPHPTDGRATLVRRTKRGWRVNSIAREQVDAIQADWANALGEADFAELMRLLRRLVRLLQFSGGVAGHPRTLRSADHTSETGRGRRAGTRKPNPKEPQA
jgi:DNA-binding MarR family transcriptional regulator